MGFVGTKTVSLAINMTKKSFNHSRMYQKIVRYFATLRFQLVEPFSHLNHLSFITYDNKITYKVLMNIDTRHSFQLGSGFSGRVRARLGFGF